MVSQQRNLDVIRVSSPCRVSWSKMAGDDQVRFCEQCGRNVYNLSEMMHEAATQLITEREGRLCVRFYRRRDGTIVTKKCEVAKQRFVGKVLRRVVAFIALMSFGGCGYQGDVCVPGGDGAPGGGGAPAGGGRANNADDREAVVDSPSNRALPQDSAALNRDDHGVTTPDLEN